jgi:signal transduction histidine kinase
VTPPAADDSPDVAGKGSLLERLVDAWPEPALVANRAGTVVAMNVPARELLRALSGAESPPLAELVGDDVAHDLLHASGDPVERVVGEDLPVGRQPVLRARGAAIGDRYVIVCLADASSETRLRSHLGFAERLASIGELLSSVAHELNNPLTTVLGYADLLLAEESPHLPRNEIQKIRDEAMRCRRIVSNLLDLARAEAVELRPLAVQQVVEKVAEFRRYACQAAGIELSVDPGAPPVVMGDFHRLVQAVLNLVTNAEDAVRNLPEPRRIAVRARGGDGRVVVEVEDNGPGVPPAVRPFIFQPFFTTKPRGKGTGLGLSLVRNTARQHGGDIRIEDAPGGGARFVLDLPVAAEAST